MDLIRAIGKEMGYEVEVQNIGFDGLIPALQAKNIDVIISGMTINDGSGLSRQTKVSAGSIVKLPRRASPGRRSPAASPSTS